MATSATPVQIVDQNGSQVTSFGGGGTAANPSVTSAKSPSNIATGQVAVGTSSTLVVPARTGRNSVTLTPTTSTVYYVGVNGVSSTTGLYVAAGASVTLSTEAAIYAAGASALTVSYIETY